MKERGKKGLNLTQVTLFLKSRFLTHTCDLQIQDSLLVVSKNPWSLQSSLRLLG